MRCCVGEVMAHLGWDALLVLEIVAVALTADGVTAAVPAAKLLGGRGRTRRGSRGCQRVHRRPRCPRMYYVVRMRRNSLKHERGGRRRGSRRRNNHIAPPEEGGTKITHWETILSLLVFLRLQYYVRYSLITAECVTRLTLVFSPEFSFLSDILSLQKVMSMNGYI